MFQMMNEPVEIVHGFLNAVETREVDAVLMYFAKDGIWQNVPHPVAKGHTAIQALLTPILHRSSKVRWDVVSEAYSCNQAWVERIDRFWIDDEEYAVCCNGVFEVDRDTGLITELRDYVDLGEWRTRISHLFG